MRSSCPASVVLTTCVPSFGSGSPVVHIRYRIASLTLLSSNTSPPIHVVEKLGGEVRVELDFYFEMTDGFGYGGPGYIHYDMRLYEGTSEDTTDLDGQKSGSYTFDGRDIDLVIKVVSEEFGSADKATADIYVRTSCFHLS